MCLCTCLAFVTCSGYFIVESKESTTSNKPGSKHTLLQLQSRSLHCQSPANFILSYDPKNLLMHVSIRQTHTLHIHRLCITGLRRDTPKHSQKEEKGELHICMTCKTNLKMAIHVKFIYKVMLLSIYLLVR